MIDTDQAYVYTRSAENLAIAALMSDAKLDKSLYSRPVDHLKEQWSRPVRFPLEEGRGVIMASLTDLQGKFNLNDLVLFEEPILARRYFVDLLSYLTIPKKGDSSELADSLMEWLDSNYIPETPGVEDDYYLGLKKPYRTSNSLMADVSEFLLIKGMTAEEWQKLKPYICVLPRTVPINVNTASDLLLQVFGVDVQRLAEIRARSKEPFKDEAMALEGQSPAVKNLISKKRFSVSSQFFELNTSVELDHKQAHLSSIIYRPELLDQKEPLRVIARNRSVRWLMPANAAEVTNAPKI